jgi:hypothetical protein
MSFSRPVLRTAVVAIATVALASLATSSSLAGTDAATSHQGLARQEAPADVYLGKYKVKFDMNWKFRTHVLKGLCIKFSISGNFTYKIYESSTTHAAQLHWENQQLNDPALIETTYNYQCTKRYSVQGITMSQSWSGYSCSFNPSITAGVSVAGSGVSIGISISGWPSCGNKTQVVYSSMYGSGSRHPQYNTGSPTAFGNYTDPITGVGLLNPPPCYGAFPSAVVNYRNGSDSFGLGNIHHPGKVCLNPH